MSREMTPRAARRVAEGHVTGAGTDVCVKCDGPKEDHRLNSDRCLTCNGGARAVTTRRGPKVEHAVLLKTKVPVSVHAAAEARAQEEGTTLPDVLAALLTAWTGGVSESSDTPEYAPLPEYTPTPDEWARCNRWLNDRPDLLVEYDGPRRKSALFDYAVQHGYDRVSGNA